MDLAPDRTDAGQGPLEDAVRPRRLSALVTALTLAACALMALQTQADPDLWGHVRYGLDILEHGNIPRTDPYSYLTTPGSWINHEWLAEVLMALAWRAGGGAGLVWLKLGAVVATLGAVLWAFHLQDVSVMTRPWLAVVAAFLLSRNFGTVRPQLFSMLCFALMLLVLLMAERGHARALLWLVPILAFWANAHGGVLAGVGFLGLWLLGRAVALRGRAWKEVVAGVLAVAATLANPYGLGLWRFLLSTATVARPEIQDWTPLLKAGPAVIALYAALLVGTLLAMALRRARLPLSQKLLYAAAALLPLAAARHQDFFAIAAPVIAGPYLPGFVEAHDQLRALAARHGRALATVTLLAVAGAWAGLILTPKCPSMALGSMRWPVQAVALLRSTGLEGRMLVPFGWGQYALWHLGPRIQVSMDGRRETVYDRATYEAYLGFLNGTADGARYIAMGDPNVALLDIGSKSHALLASQPGWRQAYADDVAVILVRVGGPFAGLDPGSVGLPHAAEPECFP